MPKLKIRMFGVCLATPLSNETAPKTVEKVTVLTPQSARSKLASDGKTQIDALYTYLIVEKDNVASESPRKADHLLRNENIHVFMLHREEVTFSGIAQDGVRLPYGEAGFPDTPTTASKDPRWICNLPSLLKGASVRSEALTEVGKSIPEYVDVRLVARSGEFTGEFPCGDKGKTKILHANVERHFAQEMALTIDLPKGEVFLQSQAFEHGQAVGPIRLRSAGGNDFKIFFVCAPLITMDDLAQGDDPCKVTNDHHHDSDVDFEFEVLWQLMHMPRDAAKPVPGLILQEGSRVDCIPGGG
jgi:hypothetical protein